MGRNKRPQKECPRSDDRGGQNEERERQRMSNGRDVAIQNARIISHHQAQTTFQGHTSRQSAQEMFTRESCAAICSGALRDGALAARRTGHVSRSGNFGILGVATGITLEY